MFRFLVICFFSIDLILTLLPNAFTVQDSHWMNRTDSTDLVATITISILLMLMRLLLRLNHTCFEVLQTAGTLKSHYVQFHAGRYLWQRWVGYQLPPTGIHLRVMNWKLEYRGNWWRIWNGMLLYAVNDDQGITGTYYLWVNQYCNTLRADAMEFGDQNII